MGELEALPTAVREQWQTEALVSLQRVGRQQLQLQHSTTSQVSAASAHPRSPLCSRERMWMQSPSWRCWCCLVLSWYSKPRPPALRYHDPPQHHHSTLHPTTPHLHLQTAVCWALRCSAMHQSIIVSAAAVLLLAHAVLRPPTCRSSRTRRTSGRRPRCTASVDRWAQCTASQRRSTAAPHCSPCHHAVCSCGTALPGQQGNTHRKRTQTGGLRAAVCLQVLMTCG